MIDMELLFLKTITLSKEIQCPAQNAWLSLLICLQGSIFEWEKKNTFLHVGVLLRLPNQRKKTGVAEPYQQWFN